MLFFTSSFAFWEMKPENERKTVRCQMKLYKSTKPDSKLTYPQKLCGDDDHGGRAVANFLVLKLRKLNKNLFINTDMRTVHA